MTAQDSVMFTLVLLTPLQVRQPLKPNCLCCSRSCRGLRVLTADEPWNLNLVDWAVYFRRAIALYDADFRVLFRAGLLNVFFFMGYLDLRCCSILAPGKEQVSILCPILPQRQHLRLCLPRIFRACILGLPIVQIVLRTSTVSRAESSLEKTYPAKLLYVLSFYGDKSKSRRATHRFVSLRC